MSNSMKSFSMALQKTLRGQASSDVLAAKAARAAKVKRMWKSALEACAGPAAAVILDHTNSIYIIRKAEEETDVTDVSRETSERNEASRTSPAAPRSTGGAFVRRKPPAGELIVYVEDSLIAAEVDARREMIKLKFLELFGEEIDEFRIRVSRGKYKLSHPYREEAEKTAAQEKAPRVALSEARIAQIDEELSTIPDKKVREALKRAMISDLEVKNAAAVEKGDNGAL